MKTAFLILGAQRSGTSVTSHILSKFGIDFGSDQLALRLAFSNQINPYFTTGKAGMSIDICDFGYNST